jgi:hypothetical protein
LYQKNKKNPNNVYSQDFAVPIDCICILW